MVLGSPGRHHLVFYSFFNQQSSIINPIYQTLHSFDLSGYKSNPFQDQSQDSEITAAFSFDRPVGKVLLFTGLVSDPSCLWVDCSEEGEIIYSEFRALRRNIVGCRNTHDLSM